MSTHILQVDEDGGRSLEHYGCYRNVELCTLTYAHSEVDAPVGRWFVTCDAWLSEPSDGVNPDVFDLRVGVTGEAS